MIKSIEFIEKKYLFLYNYKHVIFMFQMLQIDSLIKVFFIITRIIIILY